MSFQTPRRLANGQMNHTKLYLTVRVYKIAFTMIRYRLCGEFNPPSHTLECRVASISLLFNTIDYLQHN